MALWGMIGGKKKERTEAVIDIGSHSIKVLVFERGPAGTPPRILKKMVDRMPLGADQLRLAAQVHKFMFVLTRELGLMPGRIAIAVGPHLADHSLVSWSAHGPKNAAEISGAALAHLFQGAVREHQEADQVVWAYPVAVSVNGYAAPRGVAGSPAPAGLAGEKVPIRFLSPSGQADGALLLFRTLVLSLSRRVADALEEARFAWGATSITFVPLPVAYLEVAGGAGEMQDFLLIDVGGEETMLMRVRAGTLESVRFFSPSAHEFARRITKETGMPFREAEDGLRAFVRGTGRIAGFERMREMSAIVAVVWKEAFLACLDEDYHLGPLSPVVILTGGGAEIPEIEAAVRDSAWIKKFSYASAPAVRTLAAHSFFDGNSLGGFLGGAEDAGLAALVKYTLRQDDLFL